MRKSNFEYLFKMDFFQKVRNISKSLEVPVIGVSGDYLPLMRALCLVIPKGF